MKFLVVLSLIVAAAVAAPAGDVEILKSDFENLGLDSYNFAYVELFLIFFVNFKIKKRRIESENEIFQ